ncbi:Actin-related protein 3 [Plecturocebus cupreus]
MLQKTEHAAEIAFEFFNSHIQVHIQPCRLFLREQQPEHSKQTENRHRLVWEGIGKHHIFHSATVQRLRSRNSFRATLETATAVKECYSCACPDLVKEFNKYDMHGPSGLNNMLESRQSQRKNFPLTLVMRDRCDLKPVFHPEFANSDFTQPT